MPAPPDLSEVSTSNCSQTLVGDVALAFGFPHAEEYEIKANDPPPEFVIVGMMVIHATLGLHAILSAPAYYTADAICDTVENFFRHIRWRRMYTTQHLSTNIC